MLANASEIGIRKMTHFRFFPFSRSRIAAEYRVELFPFRPAFSALRQPVGFQILTDRNVNGMASRVDIERFIMEVASYHFLYDKTSKEYRDTEMKKAVWELIGKKFGMSGASNRFILSVTLLYHTCRNECI